MISLTPRHFTGTTKHERDRYPSEKEGFFMKINRKTFDDQTYFRYPSIYGQTTEYLFISRRLF